jgi:hypothetical protein
MKPSETKVGQLYPCSCRLAIGHASLMIDNGDESSVREGVVGDVFMLSLMSMKNYHEYTE